MNVAMNTLLVARRDAAIEAREHAELMFKGTAISRARKTTKMMDMLHARRGAEASAAQQAAAEAVARLAEHEAACTAAATEQLTALEQQQLQQQEHKSPRTAAEVEAQLEDMRHVAQQAGMATSKHVLVADKRLSDAHRDMQVVQYELRELEDELDTVALLAERVGALEMQVDSLPADVSGARAELDGTRAAVAKTASAIEGLGNNVRGCLDDGIETGLQTTKNGQAMFLGHDFLQASENKTMLYGFTENIERQQYDVQALQDRITKLEVEHAAAIAAKASQEAASEDKRAALATTEAMATSAKLDSISAGLDTIRAQHLARDHARAASIERTLDVVKQSAVDVDVGHAILEDRLSDLEERMRQCEAEAVAEDAGEVVVKEEDADHPDRAESRAEQGTMQRKTMRWIDMQRAFDASDDSEEATSLVTKRAGSNDDMEFNVSADDLDSSQGLDDFIRQQTEVLQRLESELMLLKEHAAQATSTTTQLDGDIRYLESWQPETLDVDIAQSESLDEKQPARVELAPDEQDLYDKAVGVRCVIAEVHAACDQYEASQQRLAELHAVAEREALPQTAERIAALARQVTRHESRAATAQGLLEKRVAVVAKLESSAAQLGAALPQLRQALAKRTATLQRLEDAVSAMVDRALTLTKGDALGLRELANGTHRLAEHLDLDLAMAVRARIKRIAKGEVGPEAPGTLRPSAAPRGAQQKNTEPGARGANAADSSAAAGGSRARGSRNKTAQAGDDDYENDEDAASVSSCDIPLGSGLRTKRKRGQKDVVGRKVRSSAAAAATQTSQDTHSVTSSAVTARLRPSKSGHGRLSRAAAAKEAKGRGKGPSN